MERLPPTFLIDWHSTKQPIKISSACTILGKTMQISHNGNSQKVVQMLAKNIRKSQATIYLLGTSAQIDRIANLKVPLLYMVALSWAETEWRFRIRQGCHVPKYVAYLNPFRWYILYAFVTDFLRKKTREIKRNAFSVSFFPITK